MGLFVGSDGSYRGWLAALLCCCAAVNDDESPGAKRSVERAEAERNHICTEQPAPLKHLPSRPAPVVYSTHGEAGFKRHDRLRPISDRPPSLKPLDFGEPSLLGRTSLPVGYKSSNVDIKRATIGYPTAFRRLELTEGQRRSLIPLQLEPRTLRDSVMILGSDHVLDHLPTETESTCGDLSHSVSSGPHPQRSQESHSSALGPTPLSDEKDQIIPIAKERQAKRPALSSYSSSSSMRSMRRQVTESQSSSSSSSSPHQSIDWSRFNRRRNSIRKPSSDSIDSGVEQEIIELNTIVEEKRSESSRSISSDGHVSAVAPLMSIRARSETLNDIGSAFSRPIPKVCHTHKLSGCEVKSESEARLISPMENRLSRPFTAMPDLNVTSNKLGAVDDRHVSKIGGWLSNIIGTAPKPVARSREDFYSCKPYHRRAVSESSSAVSELDSPGLTIASQWSTGHKRTVTADSVMTPTSTAPSTGRGVLDTEHMGHGSIKWIPQSRSQSEVGLAL